MLNCNEATKLLSKKMDIPLFFQEESALLLHLCICQSCRNYGKQIKSISKISKIYTQIDDFGNQQK